VRGCVARIRPTSDQSMPNKSLAAQKSLVTGASSGIGRAVAVALGRAGADVVVNYLSSPSDAEAIAGEIRSIGGKSYAHQADVSSEGDVIAMFQRLRNELGTLDILIANAGVQQDAPIDRMTLAQWNHVLSVDLTGQFLCAREAIREFRRRGATRDVSRATGKIIFISSVHQEVPWAGHVNYAAAKGGVGMLMRSLAQEVASEGVRVNAIAPGAIRTPINRAAWETEQARQRLISLIPCGRLGEPEDVARAAVWLASDDADYVVGTTLFVDGGMTLYPCFIGNG
jgi:glucose 1-dehydrogenase